jgi:hypothetical protein
MVNNKIPMMDSTNTAILATSCQAGIPLTPSRIITTTGAERGKMVKKTQTGLSGKSIIRDMNQRGISKGIVKIPINCCPSWELELTAPMLAEITANNE